MSRILLWLLRAIAVCKCGTLEVTATMHRCQNPFTASTRRKCVALTGVRRHTIESFWAAVGTTRSSYGIHSTQLRCERIMAILISCSTPSFHREWPMYSPASVPMAFSNCGTSSTISQRLVYSPIITLRSVNWMQIHGFSISNRKQTILIGSVVRLE